MASGYFESKHAGDSLWDPDAFFALPECALGEETGISPLDSRHQPTGFSDSSGRWWIRVETDSGVKRQELL